MRGQGEPLGREDDGHEGAQSQILMDDRPERLCKVCKEMH